MASTTTHEDHQVIMDRGERVESSRLSSPEDDDRNVELYNIVLKKNTIDARERIIKCGTVHHTIELVDLQLAIYTFIVADCLFLQITPK